MSYTKYRLLIDAYTTNTDEKEQVIAMLNRIIGEVSSLELHSSVQISQTKEANTEMDTQERTGDGRSGSCYPELSVRQQEITILLAANYSVQKIAKQLFLSENTVRKHIQNIKKILGIHESGVDFIYALKSRQEEVRNQI
ncbi:LuxR C-terminal-related transcriptional regulator [Paenibacillus sp. V4I5]|uniref:LuxR C-terminal-related transcriptional regulator n=1 Tax=Paenibacillus sp. V4I5 TaxID=3042306 RepID=UPI0027947BA4|nr:LuxR C-terminal-related transcriptional regulator [Paenibacillus sp. V4I5]MDQ0916528.1 DNA-binding NarL/FixJ family response regulator [Paenibacillus sp. V4I5]